MGRCAAPTPLDLRYELEVGLEASPATMTSRRPNHRLAKIHRNYSVEEAARRFGVHRNTVRAWIKAGLPTCDGKRPTLILGRHLLEFLKSRREARKSPCRPGEVYCVRCRSPRAPSGDLAEYRPITESVGDLVAICPTCDSMMYRRVSLPRLDDVRGNLDVHMQKALPLLCKRDKPSANSDLKVGV